MKKKVISLVVLSVLSIALLSGCSHEHQFGDWKVVTPATCTVDGEQERSCEKCDEKETQVIKAVGHQFGDWTELRTVSCTEDGLKEHICSVCNEVEQEVVPSEGHTFVEATLLEPKTCSACGKEEGEPLAKVVKKGKKVKAENHEFTIEDIYFSSKVSEKRGNHTSTYGTEGNYLIFKLSFTNLSTESLENHNTTRFSDIKLSYDEKFEYEGDYRLLIANEIVPLATDNLFLYFTVPEQMNDDKANKLYATFNIDGTDYAIVINKGKKNKDQEKSEDKNEEEKAVVDGNLSKGDTKTDDTNFSFKLTDTYYTTKISEKRGNHTSTYGNEGHYFVIQLDFTNLMAEPFENNGDRITNIKLKYDDKYEYEGNSRTLIDDEIVPLANGNVFVFFEVPEDLESKEGPLVATFTVDGVDFTLDCRK